MSHYFIADDSLEHQYETVILDRRGIQLKLTTDRGVFSRKNIDFGTKVLIDHLALNHVKNALDLGCGYGPIGLFIARYNDDIQVLLADVNERALALAQTNITNLHISNARTVLSDVFSSIEETFDLIVTNPPIRAGKKTVFDIYEASYNHLNDGGCMYVVIQKKQGAPSSVKKLELLFGNCEIVAKTKGYWVLLAKK